MSIFKNSWWTMCMLSGVILQQIACPLSGNGNDKMRGFPRLPRDSRGIYWQIGSVYFRQGVTRSLRTSFQRPSKDLVFVNVAYVP